MTGSGRRSFLHSLGGAAALAGLPRPTEASGGAVLAPGTSPGRFWERLAAATPLFVRPRARKDMVFPMAPAEAASRRLDELKEAGVEMVEVYAPALAGNSFLGLDTIDRYRVDPRAGTMDDFKRLVELAHEKGMWIVNIDNFGYASVEAVDFLKACDDVRAGRDTRESRFFVWSDGKDAPPPGIRGDRFFMVRPTHLPGREPGTFIDTSRDEFWAWSERAGKYYWTKWEGVDLTGNEVRLPQFDWGSPELVDEVEKVVRFWMDTGIDGIMIDAVNWYVDCDWAKNRRAMTDAIASYGDRYCQPEGAGAFRDDPVSWIAEGHWSCVQDYGLGIFWEKGSNVVANAIESGDPRSIEPALRHYHDRVVHDAEQPRLLKLKTAHPALHNLARRQALPVAAPDRHYAFAKVARDGGERLLVVLNFRPGEEEVQVDLSGLDFRSLADLDGGPPVERVSPWRGRVPGYGYRFLRLDDGRGAA